MRKTSRCLLLISLAAALLAGGLAVHGFWQGSMNSREEGSIEIIGEAEPDPAAVKDVRQAVDTFPSVLESTTGIRLHHPVKVYVTGSEQSYKNVLKDAFHLSAEEAGEIAALSGGWTGGRRGLTAINAKAGVMSTPADRISTTGHELFHQVQYELSRGRDTDEKALFWLEEGSADYFGAVLASHLGQRPVDKWMMDVKAELLGAAETASPDQLQHNNLEQRKALMKKNLHSYAMSDLMSWYLLSTRAEGIECRKLGEYFERLGQAERGEQAFQETFGIALDDFLREFRVWWQQEQKKEAVFHFVSRKGVREELADELARQAQLAQQSFQSHFGGTLHGEYQIVLASDQQDLSRAVQEFCGMNPEKASTLAASSLWIENGSTVLINVGQLDTRRQQIFSMGTMLMRIMQSQRSGHPAEDMEWLVRGAGYVMGTVRLSESGYGALTQYRQAWLSVLRQSGRLPPLSRMETADGYQSAAEEFSEDTVSVLAEYAVLRLVDRYGWQSLADWQDKTRLTGDSRRAFRQVYGQDCRSFEKSLESSLGQSLLYTK